MVETREERNDRLERARKLRENDVGTFPPSEPVGGKIEFEPYDPARYKGTVMRIPQFVQPNQVKASPMGWECPRCHSVWGPTTAGCDRCNAQTTGPAKRMGDMLQEAVVRLDRAHGH